MANINFFESTVNRGINKDNVKKHYYSIASYGFLTQIRKIKTVKVNEGEKYKAITVKPKTGNTVSVSNWKIVEVEKTVNAEEEIYATVDGQHAQIALAILAAENNPKATSLKEEEYIEHVDLPTGMNVSKFISLLNYGRSWTYADYINKDITTGNTFVDDMYDKCDKYVADFIYSLYTISIDLSLNNRTIIAMKNGRTDVKKEGLNLLNAGTKALGDKLLQAFENSNVGEETFNKGKLGKGLKMFYNSLDGNEKTEETLTRVIGALNKNFWEGGKPSGSPETKQYSQNFAAVWKRIKDAQAEETPVDEAQEEAPVEG